jgi:hypothetical protein
MTQAGAARDRRWPELVSRRHRRAQRRFVTAGTVALLRRAAKSEAVRRAAKAGAEASIARARRARARRSAAAPRNATSETSTSRTATSRLVLPMAGAVVGGIVVYLFDPEQGARRRAVARDKIMHSARRATEMARRSVRDIRKRAFRAVDDRLHVQTADEVTAA